MKTLSEEMPYVVVDDNYGKLRFMHYATKILTISKYQIRSLFALTLQVEINADGKKKSLIFTTDPVHFQLPAGFRKFRKADSFCEHIAFKVFCG